MSEILIDIRPDYLRIVRDILHKHVPQHDVWAFGSRVLWTAKHYSDLDLVIICDAPLSITTMTALIEDFAESDLPWRVDVVDWATTGRSFRTIIEQNKVVVQVASRMELSDWKETTLGKFSPFIYGKALPERDRIDGTVPVISSAGVTGFHNQALVPTGGIVIGRKGTVGSITFTKQPFWAIDTAFYIADEPEKRDLRFTYYLLKTLGLSGMNSDSAVPGLNRENAHALSIRVPILPTEQRVIADVLGRLDDKIDFNQRMNETLEAMARTLFKNWFVDYGPVRAKMEGRQPPGLAADIAALFPDALDAEGKPEGWEMLSLDGVADFLNGLALQKFPGTADDDLPVIKIAELRAGVAGDDTRASKNIPSQYVVEDGDILFSWSGSLIQRIWTGGRGALNQHLFKVTSTRFPKWFHYYWVEHHLPSFQAIAASKATTMGHIQRHHLTEAKTVVGSVALMAAADAVFAPLFGQIIANSLEARTLDELRDLLLPKLLSGEIRINQAARIIEDSL